MQQDRKKRLITVLLPFYHYITKPHVCNNNKLSTRPHAAAKSSSPIIISFSLDGCWRRWCRCNVGIKIDKQMFFCWINISLIKITLCACALDVYVYIHWHNIKLERSQFLSWATWHWQVSALLLFKYHFLFCCLHKEREEYSFKFFVSNIATAERGKNQSKKLCH